MLNPIRTLKTIYKVTTSDEAKQHIAERKTQTEAKTAARHDKKLSDRLAPILQEYPDAHHISFGLTQLAYITGEWLVIEPKRAKRSQKQGAKRIKISIIMAVKYKAAVTWKGGFLRFDQPGQPQQFSQSLDQNSRVLNENVIDFMAERATEFVELRDYVESHIG